MSGKILDIEALHTAIMGNNWGIRVCKDDSFYRLIYKLEKQGKETSISNNEMHMLFASYKIWYERTLELLAACNSESKSDQEARAYGEKFKKDIVEHVLLIVTESQAETEDWGTKLIVCADVIAESIKNKSKMET